jgi:hypothetical protein
MSIQLFLPWCIIQFVAIVTRWVSLVEQELLTIPEYLESSQVISRVRVTPSLVFWVVCMCSFFLSDIVLPVFRFKASDYLFGIFWLLLWYLLITSLVSSDYFFDIFWLLLWYLLITSLVSSNYFFGIFKHFLLDSDH